MTNCLDCRFYEQFPEDEVCLHSRVGGNCFEPKNQCQTDGCSYMVEGRCVALNYNPKTWTLRGNKGCHAFTKKETKMLEEKDCRRCEKFDEGRCVDSTANFEVRMPETACQDFTPILGRDCRNCEGFNGKDQYCTNAPASMVAHVLTATCDYFNPIQTSKPSPTILTFQDIRIVKGDKTLSLKNIWDYKPCGEEFRDMTVVFTSSGFNIDSVIPFTQENLGLLSPAAFNWLLSKDFFLKAPKEEPTYKVGQWFECSSGAKYLICNDLEDDKVILIYIGGGPDAPGVCADGVGSTVEELAKLPTVNWKNLKPINSPLG